jgi:hypothetical protein
LRKRGFAQQIVKRPIPASRIAELYCINENRWSDGAPPANADGTSAAALDLQLSLAHDFEVQ